MIFGKSRRRKNDAPPVDIITEANKLLESVAYDRNSEANNDHCIVRIVSETTNENDRGTNPLHRVAVYVTPKGTHNVATTAKQQDLKLTISGRCSSDGLAFDRKAWEGSGLVASFDEYKNTLIDPSFHLTLS